MYKILRLLSVVWMLAAVAAWGQASRKEPHIGYIYPAGGQSGTTIEVTVGGQALRGAKAIHVSGGGIRGEVVKHYPPLGNVKKEEYDELVRVMKELRQKRLAKQEGREVPDALAENPQRTEAGDGARVSLPQHPLLYKLEAMSLRQLDHVQHEIVYYRRRQMNAQIAESVVLQLAIAPDAALGPRELRIVTSTGLTNPIRFEVTSIPEVRELEPNEAAVYVERAQDPATDVPVVFNGQIQPGDVDRLRFRARKGQRIVIQAEARQLMPYLADAVPGWFQATLTVYDSQGSEVAFADDYGFRPDPVLLFKTPRNDDYEVEIRDSIYRGRDDFVYRVAVGELPFVTQIFPLGGAAGHATHASVKGWNLHSSQVQLATDGDAPAVRETALRQGPMLSNSVNYEVNTLRECAEDESNDSCQKAQPIDGPCIINGRIDKPGDTDVYAIKGEANAEIVAEVVARRVDSQLDSLVRIADAEGNAIAFNDDTEDKGSGMITHHADSYVRAAFPASGTYFITLTDAQHGGGAEYGYRLRVSPPQPDFALRVTPSSINVSAGRSAVVCLYALRKDGFTGPIDLRLAGAPEGMELNGATIPEGCDRIRVTLTAAARPTAEPVPIAIEGLARVSGGVVRHVAAPADDMMQAFIYRHLTPSQELLVHVMGSRWKGKPVALSGMTPVRVPSGGSAEVRVTTPPFPEMGDIQLALVDPPPGISLGDITAQADGLSFALNADNTAKAGAADNMIVEAYLNPSVEADGKAKRKQRTSLGVLPAIPIRVVEK